MTETIFAQAGRLLTASTPGSVLARMLAGALLAIVVAGGAWRARLLSRSGFAAAVACGTLSAAAGWKWAALLVLYFVAASAVSRTGAASKGGLANSVVAKTGARDAIQVLANGGVYTVSAVLSIVVSSPLITAGALGALAAASADSWATEIGLWLGGYPRLITTRTIVRKGESGGVSAAGIGGSLAGAAVVAGLAISLGFSRGAGIASLVAGVAGSFVDSLLGATVQEKRWCDACDTVTERTVHLCGATTRRIGGIQSVDNDVVNLLSTFAGFLLGMMVYGMIES